MGYFKVELKSESDVQPYVYENVCDEKGLQKISDLKKNIPIYLQILTIDLEITYCFLNF